MKKHEVVVAALSFGVHFFAFGGFVEQAFHGVEIGCLLIAG